MADRLDPENVAKALAEYAGGKELAAEYVTYGYTTLLPDNEKSALGKYYTPKALVDTAKEMLSPYIEDGMTILDPAAGGYSVMEACRLTGKDFIGCDIEDFGGETC